MHWCQNAPIDACPVSRRFTAFFFPTNSNRSVGPITRTNQYTAQAMTGICILRQRDIRGIGVREVGGAFDAAAWTSGVVWLSTAI
jgi:hypothetical protein